MMNVFRHFYQEKRVYTYRDKSDSVATRIDRFYVNKNLTSMINQSNFFPTINRDHILSPTITLNFPNKFKWCPGLFCLNNQILKHSCLKVEIENAWQNWKIYKQSFSNVLEWWDTEKCILRNISKKFSIDLKHTEMLTHDNNKRTLLQIINQDSLTLEDERLKTELENKIQN